MDSYQLTENHCIPPQQNSVCEAKVIYVGIHIMRFGRSMEILVHKLHFGRSVEIPMHKLRFWGSMEILVHKLRLERSMESINHVLGEALRY